MRLFKKTCAIKNFRLLCDLLPKLRNGLEKDKGLIKRKGGITPAILMYTRSNTKAGQLYAKRLICPANQYTQCVYKNKRLSDNPNLRTEVPICECGSIFDCKFTNFA